MQTLKLYRCNLLEVLLLLSRRLLSTWRVSADVRCLRATCCASSTSRPWRVVDTLRPFVTSSCVSPCLGDVPDEYRPYAYGGRLVAPTKPGGDGHRPLGAGTAWRRVAAGFFCAQMRGDFQSRSVACMQPLPAMAGCAAGGYLFGSASVRCLWPPLVAINADGATLDAKPVYGKTATNPVNRPKK